MQHFDLPHIRFDHWSMNTAGKKKTFFCGKSVSNQSGGGGGSLAPFKLVTAGHRLTLQFCLLVKLGSVCGQCLQILTPFWLRHVWVLRSQTQILNRISDPVSDRNQLLCLRHRSLCGTAGDTTERRSVKTIKTQLESGFKDLVLSHHCLVLHEDTSPGQVHRGFLLRRVWRFY